MIKVCHVLYIISLMHSAGFGIGNAVTFWFSQTVIGITSAQSANISIFQRSESNLSIWGPNSPRNTEIPLGWELLLQQLKHCQPTVLLCRHHIGNLGTPPMFVNLCQVDDHYPNIHQFHVGFVLLYMVQLVIMDFRFNNASKTFISRALLIHARATNA